MRRQIAYHYLDTIGVQVEPDQICITNGGQEALLLALKAVASPGDVIARLKRAFFGRALTIRPIRPENVIQIKEYPSLISDYVNPISGCMI
ncbi:MAG: hypothetical protein IIB74_10430 [Proteobacteria bacterium]|nr:hypothetical protein [Pseudomonadota bacterium]